MAGEDPPVLRSSAPGPRKEADSRGERAAGDTHTRRLLERRQPQPALPWPVLGGVTALGGRRWGGEARLPQQLTRPH